MKDQPRLIDTMRQPRRDWEQTPQHTRVPMHDFVTRAAGDGFSAKMATGEWDDLTAQVAKHLPLEQQLKPGERIIGHRYTGVRYDPGKSP